MALNLVTFPQIERQFYLSGNKASSTYRKATAANRLYPQMGVPPKYDKKITYRIFFSREDRSNALGMLETKNEFGRAFIPTEMEQSFPHDFHSHPMKPFDITASYHCMTFIFHIKGSMAITRNYWRSQNQEIEVVKNLGKLMVTEDLKRNGVLFIIPRIDESIKDYSMQNLANYKAYPIGQITNFFISDPRGRKLDEPILENPMQ